MIRNRYDEPHTFIVEGRGEFPFDMLRRDQAWPADTTSAMAMDGRGLRRVAITASCLRHITPARWESFGWPVVQGFDEFGGGVPIDDYIVGRVAPKLEVAS